MAETRVSALCKLLEPGVRKIATAATKLIRSEVRNEAATRRDRLIALGASEEIVRGLVRLFELDGVFGIAALAAHRKVDELALTNAYTKLGEALGLDWAQQQVARFVPSNQWERLLKVIAREDLLNAEGYQTPRERFAHQKEIDAIMEAWTLQHDKHEVMRILGSAGIPAGAVFDTRELRDDAYLRQRGTFVTVKHPVRGDFTMPGWPVKMSDSNVTIVSSPMLGQHQ